MGEQWCTESQSHNLTTPQIRKRNSWHNVARKEKRKQIGIVNPVRSAALLGCGKNNKKRGDRGFLRPGDETQVKRELALVHIG